MKKLKYLVLLLAVMLVMPFTVFAEGEENEGEPVVTSEENADQRAVIYFFRGEGCGHCAEAEAWFESIQEEYGSKFVIKDYETWYDSNNSDLMKQVAESRGEYDETNFGVPYILIGDKSWMGFSEATMADEIKAQIDQVYAQPVNERHDSLASVNSGNNEDEEKSSGSDVVVLLVILAVAGGLGFGIYKSRQSVK